ncbi:MAG TPA: thioesterase family protein [Myxococcaceae bacterium]|nr:thioesterase family protein [Myxococcaceae bacterium]
MGDWTIEVTLDVAWGEMDALGHVNNIRYIAWAETARIALFRKLGMATLPGEPVGPILARIENDYLEPVEYPARVTVGIRAERVGNTSIVLGHEIWHAGAPDRVVARGRAVVVLLDYSTQEKVRVPDSLRKALGA